MPIGDFFPGRSRPIMAAMNTHPIPQARALRSALVALSAALLLAACAAPTASTSSTAADSASLDAAISGPQRSDKNRARDVYRHPKETLQFFGVASSQTVLEIAPGGGWYTEILAPYLHDHGKLYEAQYDSPDAASLAEEQAGRASFARKLSATPAIYSNVVVGTLRSEERRVGKECRP